MRISLIHPSRSRSAQAAATAKKWLSSAKRPELIEYIFSLDTDDETYPELYSLMKDQKGVAFNMGYHTSAIHAINKAAEISTGDLLIAVSDDFSCPFHWDEALRTALQGKSDYLVKTDDGAQPWIITLPIMDRVYYHRFGYVYHPEYKHLFADTEMTHVGEMLGRTIKMPITFRHNHYTTGETAKDDINVKNDKTWGQGEKLYIERMIRNFDLPENKIVNPVSQVPGHHSEWLKSKGIEFVIA